MKTYTGFLTLLKRENMRFLSLANQTLLPSVVTTVLYIVVFGFFLGRRVSNIDGFSYIIYIFPGLLMMGVVMAAFQNSSTSLFIARQERFIDDLLVAPITFFQMVLAYVLSATLRGMIMAVLGILVCLPLARVPLHHPFLFLLALTTSCIFFASFGVIAGLWAERWDHIAVIQNYIITPLVFLGGVFYSSSTVPATMQWINAFNPLFYLVSAVRYAFLDKADLSFSIAFSVTFILAVGFFSAAVILFKKGYKLRS